MQSPVDRPSIISATERPIWKELGHDSSTNNFRQTKGRPTFIVLDSHIGYSSPNKQGSAAAHGEPLGEEEVRLPKRYYGWPEDAKFLVPEGVYDHFAAGIGARSEKARHEWTRIGRNTRSSRLR